MAKRNESENFQIDQRNSVLCGVAGEMVVLQYGDAKVGFSERVVTIEDLFAAAGNMFVEGFCHSKGEIRTFRFDRIHTINELPSGGYYTSVTEWMKSYGVAVEIYGKNYTFKYRIADRSVRRRMRSNYR